MRFLLFLYFALIPFGYYEIYGVRMLLPQVLIGIGVFLYFSIKINRVVFLFDYSMALFFTLVLLVFFYSLESGYINEFLAVAVFFLLMLFTAQIDKEFLLDDAVRFYKYAVLFTAFGLFFQFVLHRLIDVLLFRYELFGGGRNAYSFIWNDYSFVSLFVVSAIPLFYERKIDFKFLFTSFFLLLCSVITSARTGVTAFILFAVLYVGYDFYKSIVSGKINKSSLILLLMSFFIPPVVIFGMESLTGRQVTFSSSGRLDDFVIGFEYFKERLVFGFLFDYELYVKMVSTIPHNLFIYMLYMGGLVAFCFFLVWFCLVAMNVRFADGRLIATLCICLLGFQFIPSFFAAYFFATLLGLAMVSSKFNRSKRKNSYMVKI